MQPPPVRELPSSCVLGAIASCISLFQQLGGMGVGAVDAGHADTGADAELPPVPPSADERQWAMLCHLGGLVGHLLVGFGHVVAPLVTAKMTAVIAPEGVEVDLEPGTS